MSGSNLKIPLLWDILIRHRSVKTLGFAIISDLSQTLRLEPRMDGTASIMERKTRGCGKKKIIIRHI